jgi:peptidoglycan DL-endopeptidase CwlO
VFFHRKEVKTFVAKSLVIQISLSTLLTAGTVVGNLLLSNSAWATPSITQVAAEIRALQIKATSAGEQAQQAQYTVQQLQGKLASMQRQANAQAANVIADKKSLGALAREEYQNGGISQGLSLLFSADPTKYLEMAGELNSLASQKTNQLRQFAAAKQNLNAASLTVSDQLALVHAAQAKFKAQAAQVKAQLAQAQALYNSLSKAERARLAALQAAQAAADQNYSRKAIAHVNLGSGRGKIALQFAINQLGKWYVWGAAGLRYWDCSGLTMRAFAQAGVSLPHSAAAQYGYGRFVPRNQLQPGDLVFFGYGSYIDHVGIYLRNGLMVNATHSGAQVSVSAFGNYFGSARYIGARRI